MKHLARHAGRWWRACPTPSGYALSNMGDTILVDRATGQAAILAADTEIARCEREGD